MIAQEQTFENLTIQLDGSTFTNCTFRACKLIYNGLFAVTLDRCKFDNVKWRFAGPAGDTVLFMQLLYKAGAVELIENTFRNIRGEVVEQGPTLH